MPEPDAYGTQQPIALLKLLVTNQGFYDRDKDLKWRRICDANYVAAMGTPRGGRKSVDARFLSHFSVFHATPPEETTLNTIYSTILHNCVQPGFNEEITQALSPVTQATLNVYSFLQQKLRPTPVKFHCIFSLRDLSRVCCGLCRASPHRFTTLAQFVRLWRHEVLRVFVDRLSTNGDRRLVQSKIQSEIEKLVPESKDAVLRDPVLFGEYKSAVEQSEIRYYEEIVDLEEAKGIFTEIQIQRPHQSNLVLFDDALNHLSRLHRIITTEGGHALCVGVSGSGKKVLIKMAAFAAECEVFQISLTRNYSENDFKEEIKTLYLRLVQENKKIVFLLSDDDVIDEGFLDVVNSMLVAADMRSLFSEEEREEISTGLQHEMTQAGLEFSNESVWRYFAQKASRNLHVALSMSPVGDTLRRRCQNFPGLVTNTTIDWFFPWPQQALYEVAKTLLLSHDLNILSDYYDAIIDHMVHVHLSVEGYTQEFVEKWRRINFVTPKHFLDYLTNYRRLLSEKTASKDALCERYVKGVEKLENAATQIKELNEKLVIQRAAVTTKTEACEALLASIAQNQALANEKQAQAMQKAKEMEAQSKEIELEKSAAESALAEALPALDQARSALNELDKADVTEIRSFVKPPRPVQVVSECICVFRGFTETSWKTAKGMMADTNFLQSLQAMDVDAISPKQFTAVKEYLERSKITMDQMQSISRAGSGLLRFVHAVLGYYTVLKDVRPKREMVAKLEKTFHQNERDLDRIKRELEKIEEDLKRVNEEYASAKLERQNLQEETTVMERRLTAADRLTGGLGSETVRWKEAAETLRLERHHLLGDCVVSAAFLSYSGPFSWGLRNRMIKDDWLADIGRREVPHSEAFRLEHLLANDVTVAAWNAAGLPKDELSIQNGLLTTCGSRFSLFIDPQQQALKWIKRMEENNGLRVATFSDSDFLKHLELAIKFG
uniref:AAA domain-containing protein n=1 Tax=Mesocestoides corti TaxID=53468 RepID=A0A5K3FBS4_MESCO